MKKLLSVILAAGLVVSMAAGCSSSGSKSSSAPASSGGSTASSSQKDESKDANKSDADEVITMRLANANPVGDVKDLAAVKFSELAAEKSNGRINIEVYSGGTLGDWRDAIEGLGLGVNEIVEESIGSYDAWCSKANIDAIPYIYRDYDHLMGVWTSDFGKEMKETIGKEGNFVFLGQMYRGARVVTSKKKFTDIDGIKGLKIRVPNVQVYIKTWELLGASPTPLALTETFTALQQNTVEAQENATVESYGFGFYDVCDYLMQTNHVYSLDNFAFDRDYFYGLPEDIQQILIEAADETSEWRNQMMLDKEQEFQDKFVEKGVEIVPIDTAPFIEKFDGFTDSVFPDLVDWVTTIQSM